MVGLCRRTWFGLVALGVLATGCADAEPTETVGRSKAALAKPGPWQIPDDVLAVGDQQDVPYTGAGPWLGEQGCYGGISPATDILRDYLYAHFPQTYSIGGYACRHIVGNSSKMSVHATGRALDIMLHTDDGEADNDIGDPIGNWLIENAEAIGIQFVIWDLYTWMASKDPGNKGKDYGGSHPHHDHLHIEVAEEYADLEYNWFEDLVTPPVIDGCSYLPPAGGVVEETSPCFGAFGPNEYWRLVEGAGHEGSLLWTNAFENDEPSNWARWNVYFDEPGDYLVEAYVDPDYGVNRATSYAVRHDGEDTTVVVDQSASQEWVALGEWRFAGGSGQHVSVFDNVEAPVDADQHIAVDALRFTRLDGPEGFDPSKPEGGSPDPIAGGDGTESTWSRSASDEGGCRVAAPGAPTTRWPLFVAGLFALGLSRARRRSTRRPARG